MYEDGEDVLCAQKVIDSNERVLTNFDGQQLLSMI